MSQRGASPIQVVGREGPRPRIVVVGEGERRSFRLRGIKAGLLLLHAGLAYGVPPSQDFDGVVRSLRYAAARLRALAGGPHG